VRGIADSALSSQQTAFLKQCAAAGYAVQDIHGWHLTPQGFLLSNQIIRNLLDL